MQKKYIIWAPQYDKSNGIIVLYKLHDALREKGYEAYIYSIPSEHKCNYITDSQITKEMRKNDIVIYPEIVVHNPLRFQNVVRYVLYYPGKNGGTDEYDDYEMKFTYLKKFYDNVDELFISTLDTKIFYKDNSVKDKNCYFIYKGGKWKDIPEFDNMIKITMQYPATKDELSKLLRETKTLYSYDDCTQLLDEAVLCGCDVKIVRENGFENFHSSYKEQFENADKNLENFIKKTQKMKYTGKIRKPPIISNTIFYTKENLKILLYKYIFHNKKRTYKHIVKKFYHSVNAYNYKPQGI